MEVTFDQQKTMSGNKSAENLTSEVKKHTRGVLLSKFGGVTLAHFEEDYRELVGKRFPYQELGFSDAQTCLESLTDTVRFEYSDVQKELVLFGIADDHSFMSSATVKAQFAPDRPISKRKTVKNKKYTGTSSDSDDSTVKHAAQTPKKCQRRKDQNQPVNGQSSSLSIQSSNQVELIPNLKGLYSICVAKLPQELETNVQELFSEVASPHECSRGGMHFFLRYKTRDEAEDVIARFNNCKLTGITLSIQPAKEKMVKRDHAKPHSSRRRETVKQELPQVESKQLSDENKMKHSDSESIRKQHGTKKAIAKENRLRNSLQNKNSTQFPPLEAGVVKQDAKNDELPPGLEYECVKPNEDELAVYKDKTDTPLENIMQQFQSLSTIRVSEPFGPPVQTDLESKTSHLNIPKPRLPSILNLADRFKEKKNVIN